MAIDKILKTCWDHLLLFAYREYMKCHLLKKFYYILIFLLAFLIILLAQFINYGGEI